MAYNRIVVQRISCISKRFFILDSNMKTYIISIMFCLTCLANTNAQQGTFKNKNQKDFVVHNGQFIPLFEIGEPEPNHPDEVYQDNFKYGDQEFSPIDSLSDRPEFVDWNRNGVHYS